MFIDQVTERWMQDKERGPADFQSIIDHVREIDRRIGKPNDLR